MSAAELETPSLPCFWDANASSMNELAATLHIPNILAFGIGFCNLPGGLPLEAENAYRDLSVVDQLMSAKRQLANEDSDLQAIRSLRNAIGHRVISLPAWEELDLSLQSGCHPALYQLSRLAVRLYMTAVMLARPPHSGWQTTYVAKIRSLIELSELGMWKVDVSSFLTWVLLVGGIAAYRTQHREFFQSSLRVHLESRGLGSWIDVRKSLEEYMWTDSACEHGAAVLWDALDIS
jgi:hypothetical protein